MCMMSSMRRRTIIVSLVLCERDNTGRPLLLFGVHCRRRCAVHEIDCGHDAC